MKKLVAILFFASVLLPSRAQEIITEGTVPAVQSEVQVEIPDEIQLTVPQIPMNEIDLSLSFGTGLQTLGVYGSLVVSLLGSLISNDAVIIMPFFVPGLSIEYDRWLNDWFAVGGNVYADVVSAMPFGFVGNFSIMPEVKFRWLNRDNLRLYSKLSAGYSTSKYCIKINDEYRLDDIPTDWMGMINATNESKLISPLFSMAWLFPPFGLQVVPIGIDFNTAAKNLDAFVELGIGTQGGLTFGLKKAF